MHIFEKSDLITEMKIITNKLESIDLFLANISRRLCADNLYRF